MIPKVCVIVPVYNAEKTLERCVESILYGQLRDISVMLVDDCSTDGSWALCRRLSDRYETVCCVQNERNRGVSYTRNRGLALTQSEYVLFADSDDWVSGRYAKRLLETAERCPDALVICGLQFIDWVGNRREQFLWQASGGETLQKVDKIQFFGLLEKLQLQQIWNKIFRRSVIDSAGLCFDENQSMGEDFQFVLDYMEAAKIRTCAVINEALYYYVRASSSSLMNKYGLVETENEYRRLEKLRDLCGAGDPAIESRYAQALSTAKNNYVYQICRSRALSREETLARIGRILGDGQAANHLREQQRLMMRESLARMLHKIQGLPRRFAWKLQRGKRRLIAAAARKQLTNRAVTLISQNCIGGVFYHDMGLQFLSPTVNLFFREPDFVRFAGDLRHYLSQQLRIRWEEEYPVGMLDDVRIDFMHYDSCTAAAEAWNRRLERVCWDSIVVAASDMEGFDDACFVRWKQIPFPKVLFTANESYKAEPGTVFFRKYRGRGSVPDLIPLRAFYKGGVLIKTINKIELKRHENR